MVEKKETKKKVTAKKTGAVKSQSSVTSRKKVTAKVPHKKNNQNLILSVILGIFIIISAFQSFQINDLKTQMQEGGIKISSSVGNSYSSSSGSGKSDVPSNLKDLPQMVGGC